MSTLGYKHTLDAKEKIRKARLGKTPSKNTRNKLSEKAKLRKGEKASNWKGGVAQSRSIYCSRRRALQNNAVGFFTVGEWEILKAQYGFTCLSCGKSEPKIKLTVDHIVPLSKGGSNFIENIQPLCRECNSSKHTQIINYKEGMKSNV